MILENKRILKVRIVKTLEILLSHCYDYYQNIYVDCTYPSGHS